MLVLMIDTGNTHERKSNIVKGYPRFTDKLGYAVPDNVARLVERALKVLMVASRTVNCFDRILFLIEKRECRLCSASVNTDIKAH